MQVGKRRKGSAYSHSLEQQVDDENGDLDDFTLMEKNDNDKRPRFSVRYLFLGAIVGLITFVLYFDVYSVREIIAGSSSFTLRGHSHLIDSSNSANSNSGSNSAVNSIGGSGSVNSNIVNSKSDSVVGDGGNHPEIPPKADQNINFEMTTDLHDKLDKELEGEVDLQLSKIRTMKQNNIVMEKDEEALFEISVLQEKLRSLLLSEYGPQPYYVEMQIEFPQSMAKVGLDQSATLLIELAPIDFVPYSVYYFIKVVENWKVESHVISN